jgi:hypothetical protein
MRVSALSIALAVSAFVATAPAQHFSGAGFSGVPRMASASHSVSSGVRGSGLTPEHPAFRRGRANILYGGFPHWWDDSSERSSVSPQIYLMPTPVTNTEASHPIQFTPSQDPLLIELRGDHYVRVSPAAPLAADAQPARPLDAGASSASSTLPTLFVFRDGHREQSDNYSIYGGVIYARAEYWSAGSTKQIPLSALDIAESKRANDERGVKFLLPAAANEVITRP